MDSKVVYEILNSALSGQKYCVLKHLMNTIALILQVVELNL